MRDADSRLNRRDISAIEDWVESDKNFHIVREHPEGHCMEMCAGMWGCKGGSVPDMPQLVQEYINSVDPNVHGIDQFFLRDVIYPRYAQHSSCVHDQWTPYREAHAMTIKRDLALDGFAFIGEAIDENDEDRWTGHPGEQKDGIKRYYYGK